MSTPSAKLRIACCQLELVSGNPAANCKRAEEMLRLHRGEVDLVILPELFTVGYDLPSIPGIYREMEMLTEAEGRLGDLAAELGAYLLAGTPLFAQKSADGPFLHNSLLVWSPAGEAICRYDKLHVFNTAGENQVFVGGRSLASFEVNGWKVGLQICYDLRFPEPARQLALGGCHLLVYPAQWPAKRIHHYRLLLEARAVENQLFVAGCNRVGTGDGYEFGGGSQVVSPLGELLAEAEGEQVIRTTLDWASAESWRKLIPCFTDLRRDLFSG